MEKKLKQRPMYPTRHEIGVCPVCGAMVSAGVGVYVCAYVDRGCDFRLWSNCMAGLKKEKITVEEMKQLLAVKHVRLEGLVNGKGEKFDCIGVLYRNQEWGWNIRLTDRIRRSSPNLPPGFGKIGEPRKKPKGE